MNSNDFRKELTKIMPGYNWTVHTPDKRFAEITGRERLKATGIQSSGFNRLSTLEVSRFEKDGKVTYKAQSAGHGTKAPWMHSHRDGTLARALRGLQDHYEATAQTYHALAAALRHGRTDQST